MKKCNPNALKALAAYREQFRDKDGVIHLPKQDLTKKIKVLEEKKQALLDKVAEIDAKIQKLDNRLNKTAKADLINGLTLEELKAAVEAFRKS